MAAHVLEMRPLVMVDGEKEARENPDTFCINSREEREGLQPGDFAKVGWRIRGGPGERMWVLVKSRVDGGYIGELNNDPVVFKDKMHCGQSVCFESRHVLGILKREDAPS